MSAVIEPLIVVSGVRSSWDTVLRRTLPSRSDSRAMRFLRFSSASSSLSMERARVRPSICRESSWSCSQLLPSSGLMPSTPTAESGVRSGM